MQLEGEIVFEAWERLKELIQLCPHHGLSEPLMMQQFYGGMNELRKQVLNGLNPQGGSNGMNEEDAQNTLERMYWTNQNWRTSVRAKPVRFPVNATHTSTMEEQLETLRNNVNAQINIIQDKVVQNVNLFCKIC